MASCFSPFHIGSAPFYNSPSFSAEHSSLKSTHGSAVHIVQATDQIAFHHRDLPQPCHKKWRGATTFSTLVLLLHFSYVSLSFPHRPASMTGTKLGILPITHICRCNSTGVYLSFPSLSHTAIVNYNLLVKIPFTKPGGEVGRL